MLIQPALAKGTLFEQRCALISFVLSEFQSNPFLCLCVCVSVDVETATPTKFVVKNTTTEDGDRSQYFLVIGFYKLARSS